jgi:hypothetical protein
MRMGPDDFSDLNYEYDASFVGDSGQTYLCEKDFGANVINPHPRFCMTLPNGVVFKMANMGTWDSGIFGGLREAWAIFLDDDHVDGFEDTKEIKDSRLRALAEQTLGDLIVKAKADKQARRAANRARGEAREAQRQAALKKLDS